MKIRELCREDLPALRILEDRCFSDAWSDALLEDLLSSEYDRCRVLEDGEKIIGYVNVRVLGDEAELMRICILPEYRGQGLSGGLLERGMEDMIRCGAKTATLEVRAGNLPAVRLYEAHGFVLEGYRKNYYRDPKEDAAIYWNHDLPGGRS
ncbi:MAG: ribosomal protein S18-alanine N-acetyltransferase [Stomatobaculum sp.]|nr:ribosomal protein S18-alanine N-acetyltransferase [Stomatobaculum sp.]